MYIMYHNVLVVSCVGNDAGGLHKVFLGCRFGTKNNSIEVAAQIRSRDALKCLSGFFDENTVHTRR